MIDLCLEDENLGYRMNVATAQFIDTYSSKTRKRSSELEDDDSVLETMVDILALAYNANRKIGEKGKNLSVMQAVNVFNQEYGGDLGLFTASYSHETDELTVLVPANSRSFALTKGTYDGYRVEDSGIAIDEERGDLYVRFVFTDRKMAWAFARNRLIPLMHGHYSGM